LVDAEDLKSSGLYPCGFESLPPYWVFCYIKVEKTRTTPEIEEAYKEAQTARVATLTAANPSVDMRSNGLNGIISDK